MTDTLNIESGQAVPPPQLAMPDFPLRVGPFGHLAAERDRLTALRWQHFDALQVGTTLGAEIVGLDLTRPLVDDVLAELRRALHEYKVIFFREQPLSAQSHAAFARQFGELEVHPALQSNEDDQALVRFEKGVSISGYENLWHHDVTWRAEPSIAAVLHAIEVPAIGGDTLFSDMYAAYESFDDAIKSDIENLDAIHDFAHAFGRVRPDQVAAHPPVRHPVVCTHPVTGRRHLYVNRAFVSHFDGQTRDESLALLDTLCRAADYPEHQVRFHWDVDSVAMWDNRAVQHYASSDYWPQVRIMERASIIGPRPRR